MENNEDVWDKTKLKEYRLHIKQFDNIPDNRKPIYEIDLTSLFFLFFPWITEDQYSGLFQVLGLDPDIKYSIRMTNHHHPPHNHIVVRRTMHGGGEDTTILYAGGDNNGCCAYIEAKDFDASKHKERK